MTENHDLEPKNSCDLSPGIAPEVSLESGIAPYTHAFFHVESNSDVPRTDTQGKRKGSETRLKGSEGNRIAFLQNQSQL